MVLPWLSVWGVERVREGCGDFRTRGSAGLGAAMGPAVIPLAFSVVARAARWKCFP